MPKTYKVHLHYPDGSMMFVGTLTAEEVGEPPARTPMRTNGDSPETGDRMTDPQRRFLFRLLGAQGIEGKKAEEHLKSYFRVSRLADVTRTAASAYIDQLVKDRKDAAS